MSRFETEFLDLMLVFITATTLLLSFYVVIRYAVAGNNLGTTALRCTIVSDAVRSCFALCKYALLPGVVICWFGSILISTHALCFALPCPLAGTTCRSGSRSLLHGP